MSIDSLVLLTTDSEAGRIAARFLGCRFSALQVIVEEPIPRSQILRRRIRRLGLTRVGGQLAFMLFQRFQQKASRRRIGEIVRAAALDAQGFRKGEMIRVPSVNSHQCIAQLQRLQPRAVLVVGTRIIEAKVLRTITAPFINYHAGITPKYRGVHGGYWANVESDPGNFGVTVHLVDEGIDTGDVLYQARLTSTAKDNFSTYPYLQLAAALPLLERAARDAMNGTLRTEKIEAVSRLWSHPTLWQYLHAGWQRGTW
jgi:methionyl-tRNA formyltransferase